MKTRQGNIFGLNILSFVDDIWDFLNNTRPEVVVVMATHVGDKVNDTFALTETFPDATIIYRSWVLDGVQMDSFEDWWEHCGHDMGTAVSKFFDAYQGAIATLGSRVWYYTANETGGAPDDDPSFAKWIEWHVELEKEARRRGLKLCHLNHGTGNPLESDYVQIDPLLVACQSGESVIGMHEYWQGQYEDDVPWTINRHDWLVDRMYAANAFVPIALTEFGFDRWNDAELDEGGWVGTGWGETACAEEVVDVLATHTVDDPHILGVAYFCWGGWGRWKDFYDISYATTFKQIIKAADFTPDEGEKPVVTPTEPTPFKTLTDLNARPAPSVSTTPYGVTPEGTEIVSDGYIESEGYLWRRFLFEGKEAYSAEKTLDGATVFMEEVVIVDPPVDEVAVILTRDTALDLMVALEKALLN